MCGWLLQIVQYCMGQRMPWCNMHVLGWLGCCLHHQRHASRSKGTRSAYCPGAVCLYTCRQKVACSCWGGERKAGSLQVEVQQRLCLWQGFVICLRAALPDNCNNEPHPQNSLHPLNSIMLLRSATESPCS